MQRYAYGHRDDGWSYDPNTPQTPSAAQTPYTSETTQTS